MACCKCCCGGVDCAEGGQGKCCCGGSSGTCCESGEYCCSGACQATPCVSCGAAELICVETTTEGYPGEYWWSGTCTGECDPYCKPVGTTEGFATSFWSGTVQWRNPDNSIGGSYECNAGNEGVVAENVQCECANPLP